MTNKPKFSMKQLFLFNGIVLLVAFTLIQLSVVRHQEEVSEMIGTGHDPVIQGEFARRFTLYDDAITLTDIQFNTAFDKELSLDFLKGQWIILNFWATWCPPCLVEMPSLQALQDQFAGQGIKVVAVSLDRNMNAEKLRKFMADKNFGPVAAYYDANNTIMKSYDLRGLPTTYILAPNGKAIGVMEGDIDWVGQDAVAFITSLSAPARR